MEWSLDFISEEDFKNHVRATIMKYGEKLESYDLKRFNSNLIDPIKLIFDKSVYRTSWEEIVNNEIFRQRDKSNNNDIGYFHQNIFSYFKSVIWTLSGAKKDPPSHFTDEGSFSFSLISCFSECFSQPTVRLRLPAGGRGLRMRRRRWRGGL